MNDSDKQQGGDGSQNQDSPQAQDQATQTSSEENAPEESPSEGEENKTLAQAEEIIAEQASQGIENQKLNPMLDRPFERRPPDSDRISHGFVILSDINLSEALVFTKEKFLFGQSVIIEFLIPQSFSMSADVVFCHHYAMRSRVISTSKPDYRLQLKFSYAATGEKESLRNFLKSIWPELSLGEEEQSPTGPSASQETTEKKDEETKGEETKEEKSEKN